MATKYFELKSRIELDLENLKKLKKRPGVIEGRDIQEIKMLFKKLGAGVLEAENDGEAACSLLNKLSLVQAVISEDGDCLCFG